MMVMNPERTRLCTYSFGWEFYYQEVFFLSPHFIIRVTSPFISPLGSVLAWYLRRWTPWLNVVLVAAVVASGPLPYNIQSCIELCSCMCAWLWDGPTVRAMVVGRECMQLVADRVSSWCVMSCAVWEEIVKAGFFAQLLQACCGVVVHFTE